jgi:asparagine synthase (glutamine-hydrolysing)
VPLPYETFALFGYSPWTAERIFREVDAGARLADLPGDFTAIGSAALGGPQRLKLVSSMVAARPYYLGRAADGRWVHGPTVFDVVRQARLPWRWNRRAVNTLALLGHTTGEDTLHADVTRVPGASIVTAEGGDLRVERREAEWTDVFAGPRAEELDAAVATLQGVFAEMAAPNAVVSLSAGFDSRLLLAMALREGLKPVALTMGFEASTDVVVARSISHQLGLEHRVVELSPGDYLRHAREIVAATSGVKTAAHWHTDLYVRASGLGPDTPHYVGSNGEFARTFFFDAGTMARAVDRGPARLLEAYLAAKLVRRARRFPASMLAGGPSALACAQHAAASVRRFTSHALDAMDAFYATERVRHFIGQGLALYALHGAPRSPFLDARFLRAAARLPRGARLGSNFHRRAIAASHEPLLAFPIGAEPVMARRAPPLYSLRRAKVVGYSPLGEVLKSDEARELIVEASGLDDLISRVDRIDAVDRYPATVEVLLTLAVAADLGAAAARGR